MDCMHYHLHHLAALRLKGALLSARVPFEDVVVKFQANDYLKMSLPNSRKFHCCLVRPFGNKLVLTKTGS